MRPNAIRHSKAAGGPDPGGRPRRRRRSHRARRHQPVTQSVVIVFVLIVDDDASLPERIGQRRTRVRGPGTDEGTAPSRPLIAVPPVPRTGLTVALPS